jgi:hypothetical protein
MASLGGILIVLDLQEFIVCYMRRMCLAFSFVLDELLGFLIFHHLVSPYQSHSLSTQMAMSLLVSLIVTIFSECMDNIFRRH